MSKKIKYQDNPWSDVKDFDIDDFKVVKNLLPPSKALRKAEIRVLEEEGVFVHLSKKDMSILKRRAKQRGVASHTLASAILHRYVEQPPR